MTKLPIIPMLVLLFNNIQLLLIQELKITNFIAQI